MMTNKEIALSYLKEGLSVIPLWSPAMLKNNPPKYYIDNLNKKLAQIDKSESPLSKGRIIKKEVINQCKMSIIKWKEYQDRLPSEEEVVQWFDQNPDANIGIVTGKISGIVVFDLDSEHAVTYAEDEGGFPETPKVKTGKGYHLYMKYPGFEVRGSVNKDLDIDIRADGGYVVAPPSIHGSGDMYDWEEGFSISEIDPAPCEMWMIDYLKSIADKTKSQPGDKKALKTTESGDKERKSKTNIGYADLLKNGCTEGARNQSATSLAGHLFSKKIPAEEIWAMLQLWNFQNSPPIDHSELLQIFESVKKLEAQNGKEEKDYNVTEFLDTTEKATTEYDEQYIRIPFAMRHLSNMESKMTGGLVGGRLYVLGGIPSAGKTVLANNLADNLCIHGSPVMFISYDDGRTELRYRTYSRFSGFEIENFNQKQLEKSDVEGICQNRPMSFISENKYVVQEMIKIDNWTKVIDKIIKRHGKAPVIIADYLRKLKTKSGSSDERLRVDGILSMLTDLAKQYNTPVLVISELARDSYKSGQRLSMASFKESGSIEYEASWLGILAAVEEKNGAYTLKNNWERIIEQDGNIDLIVFKAKRGTGMTGKIPLKLDKAKMTVKDRIDENRFDTATNINKASKYE